MRFLIVTAVFMFIGLGLKADQLAWLSKENAEKGADIINNSELVYLFCGCCDDEAGELITIINVEVSYTGTDDYYEVIIEFEDAYGEYQSEAVDLAYVWTYNEDGERKTIGQLMGLEHDPCSNGEFEVESY